MTRERSLPALTASSCSWPRPSTRSPLRKGVAYGSSGACVTCKGTVANGLILRCHEAGYRCGGSELSVQVSSRTAGLPLPSAAFRRLPALVHLLQCNGDESRRVSPPRPAPTRSRRRTCLCMFLFVTSAHCSALSLVLHLKPTPRPGRHNDRSRGIITQESGPGVVQSALFGPNSQDARELRCAVH